MTQAVYTKLPDRAFICITGDDRRPFLQGLITQDIDILDTQPLLYSCLLTPNGKFLFDFFISENGETIILDCEGGERASALFKRLSMFKLRSNVTLELQDNIDAFQIFNGTWDDDYKDPRHKECGYRTYSKPNGLGTVEFNTWDKHRIQHEIPDGSHDLIPEKSFIHESDIVIESAVSYTKGCYMGQELVSRMHHRGLAKKKLRCIDIKNAPEGADLRSTCGDVGLALTRLS
jgi:folate-binding protein YgfZ